MLSGKLHDGLSVVRKLHNEQQLANDYSILLFRHYNFQ